MLLLCFLRSGINKFPVFASRESLPCSPEFLLAIDHLPKSGSSILLVFLVFSDSAFPRAWPLHLETHQLFLCSNFSHPFNLLLYALAHVTVTFPLPRYLLLSLALPLLQIFHSSSPMGGRISWEHHLVIKMQTQSHSKVIGMLYVKYISTGLLVAMLIFLCISFGRFRFVLPSSLKAEVPVLSTLCSRMLLHWEFVLIDLRLVDIH